jgi:hypothetical protein
MHLIIQSCLQVAMLRCKGFLCYWFHTFRLVAAWRKCSLSEKSFLHSKWELNFWKQLQKIRCIFLLLHFGNLSLMHHMYVQNNVFSSGVSEHSFIFNLTKAIIWWSNQKQLDYSHHMLWVQPSAYISNVSERNDDVGPCFGMICC